MSARCPFLERLPEPRGALVGGCGTGINFYSVGEGENLCRTCPVPTLVSAPHCEHLEFYTFVQNAGSGRLAVGVAFSCTLAGWGLDSLAECEACPNYEEVERQGRSPALPVAHSSNGQLD